MMQTTRRDTYLDVGHDQNKCESLEFFQVHFP